MLKVEWPPIRDTFIPDPGWTFFDMDLAGADAQVVAWECNDEDLKSAFRRKIKIHAHNALAMYGPEIAGPDGKREPLYTRIKRGVHLTNYGGQTSTLASKCGMSISEATKFQHDWFSLHPGIVEWHERTDWEIQTVGMTTNKFGYSIPWNDRPSKRIWRQALGWKPQSTVAHVTEEAMLRIWEEKQTNKYFEKYLRIVLNVHDSLVAAIKTTYIPAIAPRLYEILHSIIVPYDDPLTIPWGLKVGNTSWGKCKETTWEAILNESVEIGGDATKPIAQVPGLDHGVPQIHR